MAKTLKYGVSLHVHVNVNEFFNTRWPQILVTVGVAVTQCRKSESRLHTKNSHAYEPVAMCMHVYI